MLHDIIRQKTKEWLNQADCPVKPVMEYIYKERKFRDAQIEAIETYLFLKIKGQNKPLAELMQSGFFNENIDLDSRPIAHKTRENLLKSPAALALYEMAERDKKGLEPLSKWIDKVHADFDTEGVINSMFYNIPYTDYLFSLPMGAGKTYLMAAIIYLDLYFATNEPENKLFAHNFIILVPSGLKSSVIPSLKTIQDFDPTWVLPETEAIKVKRLLTFEVLDQNKGSKKEQRKRNPNALKIASHAPLESKTGLVMVVNAEKVILDRLDKTNQTEAFERTEDELDQLANELRNIIGKLPNLQIHIDEVHHAQDDDIKLRQVVTNWNKTGSINAVLGYSGTPYLSSPDKIDLSNTLSIRQQQITNTVYYYPLVRAVRTFLKKTNIRAASMNDPLSIIGEGVKIFKENYWETVYKIQKRERVIDVTAKLAIYCASIDRLENEVMPYLTGTLGIDPKVIFKYHRGNKQHKMSKADDVAFAQLDTEMSSAKIVLLVQIGKEGWDCRSLSGVILSQKGDCPKNMTLQTACRCLREAVFHENETGLILLNDHNWKTLNAQLQEEQHTTIEQLNKAKTEDVPMRERVSRMDFLNLPNTIEYFKVKLKDAEVVDIVKEDPSVSLAFLLEKLKNNTSFAVSNVREGNFDAETITRFITEYGSEQAVFNNWLLQLMRHSLGVLDLKRLQPHFDVLKAIFETITYVEKGVRYWNANFINKNIDVNKHIRLAFIPQKTIEYAIETVPHTAEWLKIGNLTPVEEADTLFPKKQEQEQILNLDADGKDATDITPDMIKNAQIIVDAFKSMGVTKTVDDVLKENAPVSKVLKNKKRTLHYTPYNFLQSNFERQLIEETLKFDLLAQHNIELYFNGDRAVSSFQIECFDKNPSGRYVRIGNYTPDFLMIQRKKGSDEIERILIIETKGGIYGHEFKRKRRFMEEDFVNENEKRFNFKKFEFLYLEDSEPLTHNIAKLQNTIKTFFVNV